MNTKVTDDSAAAIHDAAMTGQGDDALPPGKLSTTKAAPPAAVLEALATAKDIASTDLVNLDAGAEYLRGAHPDFFPTLADAAQAIKDAA